MSPSSLATTPPDHNILHHIGQINTGEKGIYNLPMDITKLLFLFR
jgi:hypothetical protein